MRKVGCFAAGVVWIGVFGFIWISMVEGCLGMRDACVARNDPRWIVFWGAALISLAAMIRFLLLMPTRKGDDQ